MQIELNKGCNSHLLWHLRQWGATSIDKNCICRLLRAEEIPVRGRIMNAFWPLNPAPFAIFLERAWKNMKRTWKKNLHFPVVSSPYSHTGLVVWNSCVVKSTAWFLMSYSHLGLIQEKKCQNNNKEQTVIIMGLMRTAHPSSKCHSPPQNC